MTNHTEDHCQLFRQTLLLTYHTSYNLTFKKQEVVIKFVLSKYVFKF